MRFSLYQKFSLLATESFHVYTSSMPNLVKVAATVKLCGVEMNNKGLADASGVSKSYLSLILNGHRSPSQDILKKMARALGVDVARLERELKGRNGKH